MDYDKFLDELDKFIEEFRKEQSSKKFYSVNDPYSVIDATNAKKVKYNFKQMEPSYYKNYDHRVTYEVKEINSLWEEIKRMKQLIGEYRSIMVEQNIRIGKLVDQIENINKVDDDKIVELNDRIEDLESRIDLLDE